MQIYSHSGAVPPLGALASLAAGLAAAIIGAFIAAYGFFYIPIVYLNVVLPPLFGAAMGYVVAKTAEWGQVRNNLITGAGGLIAGLAGLYLYWGAYVWAFFGIARTGHVAFLPRGVLFLARYLFENGYWGFTENEPVKGWFLVAIWIAEAAIIIGFAVGCSLLNARRPFCESCRAWTEFHRGIARLAGTGSEPGWEKVLAGDLPALAEFSPALPGATQFVRLDLARCPRCATSRFLTITAVTTQVDKQGKTSEKKRALAANVVVSSSQAAVVEACGQLYEQSLEVALEPQGSAEAGGSSAPDDEEGESE